MRINSTSIKCWSGVSLTETDKPFQPQLIDLSTKDFNMTELKPNTKCNTNNTATNTTPNTEASQLAYKPVERRVDKETRHKIDELQRKLAASEDSLEEAVECVSKDKQIAVAVVITILGSLLIHYGLIYLGLGA